MDEWADCHQESKIVVINMPYTWVELSESAIKHNISSFRNLLLPDVKLIVCVKGNAYGHGLVEVSRIIQDEADMLAVINLREAHELRRAEVTTPILVLGYIRETEEEILWCAAERVEIVVNSLTHAQRLSGIIESSKAAADLKIHVKIDTGMARMGILPEHAVDYISKIYDLPHLRVRGVMSHFADITNHRDYSQEQLDAFTLIRDQLRKKKIEPLLWHIAKTEAILDFPESHLDGARLGIGLYGLWPNIKLIDRLRAKHPEFKLKPVLTWKAKILQVKDFPAGQNVGYGCTYTTERKTRVAVIPVGYYEGYSRGLSNPPSPRRRSAGGGIVLIRGQRCPIVGRICMNMSMVDVTDAAGARRDDEAVLIGRQGDEEINAYEIADMLDTICYEVVTRINPFIEKRIVE